MKTARGSSTAVLVAGIVVVVVILVIRTQTPKEDTNQVMPTSLRPTKNSSPVAPQVSPTVASTPVSLPTPTRSMTEPSSAANLAIYLIQLEGRADREQQLQFVATLSQTLQRPVEVVYQYTTTFNGLAVKLTPEEVATVAAMAGVRQVQLDARRYPQGTAGPEAAPSQ